MVAPRLTQVAIAAAGLLLAMKLFTLGQGGADWSLVPVATAETKTATAEPAAPAARADAPKAESKAEAPLDYSAAEIEVLQALTKRREQIEARAGELDLRENMLKVAEKRVDERIAELKKLEAQINALVKQADEQEEQNLRSLVKVYENMKPGDAARIFEKLEDKVLLSVVERMKEAKLAPVLAVMDPGRAQKLTVDLATRRQVVPKQG